MSGQDFFCRWGRAEVAKPKIPEYTYCSSMQFEQQFFSAVDTLDRELTTF